MFTGLGEAMLAEPEKQAEGSLTVYVISEHSSLLPQVRPAGGCSVSSSSPRALSVGVLPIPCTCYRKLHVLQ